MASGKAIVSTPTGAEGLPVTHSKDILLATEPKAFADHVIRLCRDEPLRKALGANARALAESGFSWRASTDVLEQAVYRSLPKNAAAPRA
jgi:glycosyltransferase involved in cell wall biosynthesis